MEIDNKLNTALDSQNHLLETLSSNNFLDDGMLEAINGIDESSIKANSVTNQFYINIINYVSTEYELGIDITSEEDLMTYLIDAESHNTYKVVLSEVLDRFKSVILTKVLKAAYILINDLTDFNLMTSTVTTIEEKVMLLDRLFLILGQINSLYVDTTKSSNNTKLRKFQSDKKKLNVTIQNSDTTIKDFIRAQIQENDTTSTM